MAQIALSRENNSPINFVSSIFSENLHIEQQQKSSQKRFKYLI